MVSQEKKLLKVAFGLAIFTMVYNLAEGILATHWGMEDESLALLDRKSVV